MSATCVLYDPITGCILFDAGCIQTTGDGDNTDPCAAECCASLYYYSVQDQGIGGNGFLQDGSSGMWYFALTVDHAIVLGYNTAPCSDFSKASGGAAWLHTGGTGPLGTSDAGLPCPPLDHTKWSGGTGFIEPLFVGCNDGAITDSSLLPDVLTLDGLTDNIQTDFADDVTKDIWDGTLTRNSGFSFSATTTGTPGDPVRVRQRDGSYAAITIETGVSFGIPQIALGGYANAYQSSSASLISRFGLTTSAFDPSNYGTTNRLLPLTVRLH